MRLPTNPIVKEFLSKHSWVKTDEFVNQNELWKIDF